MPLFNMNIMKIDDAFTYWDSRTSPEDMEEMWNHPEVHKQWMKSREKRGQVRFFLDAEKRLYLSRIELRVGIYRGN